jgi:hypothetical protein
MPPINMLNFRGIQNCVFKSEKTCINMQGNNEVKTEINGKQVLCAQLTNKQVYTELKCYMLTKSKQEEKWEMQYGQHQWNMVYRFLKNNLIDRKVKEFQWLLINNAIYTETKLVKMKVSDGKCKLCGVEMEDIIHLLYECETIGNIWQYINTLCKQISEVSINEASVMLGMQNVEDSNINELIDFILLTTKWEIWKRRNVIIHQDKWIDDCSLLQIIKCSLKQRLEVIKCTKWGKMNMYIFHIIF